MDTTSIFQRLMADARSDFASSHGSYPSDLFDYQVATGANGASAQAIDNAAYRLANGALREELTEPDDPTTRAGGLDGGSMAGWPDVVRKRRLLSLLQPEMDAFTADCKRAEYTGWSKESRGPVRRVRRGAR